MASGDIHLSAAPVSSIPTGRLLCDGSAVSRTTYAALFAAIGTTYGPGDGSTTFNLPNLSQRIPIGCGGGYTLGLQSGAAEYYIEVENLPQHTHNINAANAATNTGNNYAAGGVNAPVGVIASDGGNGGGLPLTTMPPTLALNWEIEV